MQFYWIFGVGTSTVIQRHSRQFLLSHLFRRATPLDLDLPFCHRGDEGNEKIDRLAKGSVEKGIPDQLDMVRYLDSRTPY